MSSDLKIEMFAYQCLGSLWHRVRKIRNKPHILEIYGDECMGDNSYLEACDIIFQKAVNCRLQLFAGIYFREIVIKKSQRCKSLSDFYDNLMCACDGFDFFGNLSVFERMLATCAYVMLECYLSVFYYEFPIDVVNVGHIIWAMYFDKFIETFYEEGGWRELKRVAKSYDLLSDAYKFLYFEIYGHVILLVSKELSVNYSQFKNAVKYDTYKCKRKGKSHISNLWIKFRIEHFETYVRIPKRYPDSINYLDAELLVQNLKLICDPTLEYDTDEFDTLDEKFQGKVCSTGIAYSKVFDKCADLKTNEDLRIQTFTISETYCDEIANNRKDFETQLRGEFPKSSGKEEAHKIANMNGSLENGKTFACVMGIPGIESEENFGEYSRERTVSLQMQTSKEYSRKSSDLELNYNLTSFDGNNENDVGETSRRNVVKCEREIMNTTDVLRTNWKDEPVRHSKIPLKNLSHTFDLCSETKLVKSYARNKIPETGLESTFNAKTEGCNENIEITYALSPNQVAATQSDRNAISENLCTPQVVAHVNKVTNTYDRSIYTSKGPDILSEKKNDPEIRNFLRMALILDDRQGIQYVRESLGCSEESRENFQVKSNKKKKRSKNKSRK